MQHRKRLGRAVAAVASTSLIGASFVATGGAAQAAVSTTAPVIINEVYGGGGNTGATWKSDFIELYNPTDEPVTLDGWSVQYASATGTTWTGTPLSGTIGAKKYYLVKAADGSSADMKALPTPDVVGSLTIGGTNAKVALASTTTLSCGGSCATDPAIVDLVGIGNATDFAGGGPAPAMSNATSVSRTGFANSANNAADFTAGAPTPTNSLGQTEPPATPDPEPPVPAVGKTIAEIQGTGSTSPIVGTVVRTTGVVTASYKTGGFNGFVIQTPGADTTPDASDAVFVYLGSGNNPTVDIGQHVVVEGTVAEFNGLTQITTTNAKVTPDASGTGEAVVVRGAWPTTDAEREKLESMLFQPTGDFTVSNTYSTNQYGEVGLASGTKPLVQWTDVARPGSSEAAAVKADNAARGVTLDDGATTNFTSSSNKDLVPPYVSLTDPVRVGAAVTFDEPVVVDYRNNAWKLNPTSQALPGGEPASFTNTRTPAPDAARLGAGDIKLASFNVLNYFTTLGADVPGCTPYKDRAGQGVTVDECSGNGPRGAWDAANLQRQQDKIVAAINAMDADVIGLLEIENSLVLGETADEATATLVAALNTADPSKHWKHVASSSDLPAVAQQDVISNAMIYRSDVVEPVGRSRALGHLSDKTKNQPFGNAREPLAQAFAPVDGGEAFLLVVNHFKSKGSAGPLAGDADTGDGQGASNASRVAQATALKTWVPTVLDDLALAGTVVEDVALVGDFNSYSQEDPMQVLYEAGYKNVDKEHNGDTLFSYSFSGLSGSLDHVLMNQSFFDRTTGADVWNINSGESVALEYSRYNNHGELFYAADPYRSSDHDPVIVAFDAGTAVPGGTTTKINLLNINDFHGRIDSDTVKFAGTIEKLRADFGEDASVFLSNGDNIGASLFASATVKDKPTIDVLNALDLAASGVGNHEFDQGVDDLTGRVKDLADFPYLAANVYLESTGLPALDEYAIVDVKGIKVGVIGAVTEETPTLVSPGGISTLTFGDPVEAVNRVAEQLSDGDTKNGEADIIVAQFHEGAGDGTPEGATLEQEVAAGGAFAEIVTQTSAEVDVIFTGHTHKEYVWSGPVPGDDDATRPIVQTGSYGANIGQVVLDVNPSTKDVVSSTARNVKRVTADGKLLEGLYPRVAEVGSIVADALAYAAVKGAEPVGSVTADITSAFAGGSYVDGKYVGSAPGTTTGRDDRGSESALGNLVANSLRDSLSSTQAGADFGVVNPGGLRAELLYAKSGGETEDGVVTYAEANAVLPFLNNLWSTTLTGAQVKTMLEQQWQTNADGTVPSRSYLQLGLSDNVSYTYDPSRPLGDRITSVTIDGELVEASDSFRVGTFSFLAQGGDNFRVLASGTGTVDTGLVDRDAWIAYLEANADLSPSFARTNAKVVGNPASVEAGSELSFEVSKLNMTSLGSPLNTALTATFTGGDLPAGGVELGDFTVTDGAVTISAPVPAAAEGATMLTLVAAPSGTTVRLPITVTAPAVTDPVVTATTLAVTGKAVVGEQLTLTATVAPAAAGKVTFRDGSTVLGTVNVSSGKASLKKALSVGTHSLTAQFVPADATAFKGSTSAEVTVTVAAAPATATSTTLAVTGKAVVGEQLTLTAKVAPAAAGKVTFRDGSTVLGTVSVTSGKASLKKALSVGTHSLTAQFVPADATAFKGSTSAKVTVTVAKSDVTISARLSTTKAAYGSPAKVSVTVTGRSAKPSGKVTVYEGSKKLATGTLKVTGNTGKASITLPKTLKVGTHKLTVKYAGTATTKPATSRSISYKVVKAAAKASVKLSGRDVVITVSAKGTTPTGKVTLRVDGRTVKTVSLTKGKATVKVGTLRKGKHTFQVKYAGSSTVNKVTVTQRVSVR